MEWKEVRLGDVCESIYSGGTPSTTNKEYWNGNLPWLSSGETGQKYIFKTEKYITELGAKHSSTRYAYKGSTVVASAGQGYTRGQASFLEIDTYVNQSVIVLKPNLAFIDSLYLYFNISNRYSELRQLSDGTSTRGSLSGRIMKEIIIKIPSLDNQRRIASILSSLDRKIELNNKINAQLEEMAQAIFKNWFVDFEPFKDGKFVESELGMIPEGWRVGTLLDLIELMPGGTPKTSEPTYWENGNIPFFSPKDVTGIYCFSTEKQITELGLDNCSSRLYPKDTIFITCRGTVGKVTLAACNMAMNQSNYAIKGKKNYSQIYIFFLVRSLVERLIKKSNGAVFSAITSKDFDEKIIIPPIEIVEKFTLLISPQFKKTYTLGVESLHLAHLRDTLLPKLMSGEIELGPSEEEQLKIIDEMFAGLKSEEPINMEGEPIASLSKLA